MFNKESGPSEPVTQSVVGHNRNTVLAIFILDYD